MSFSQNCTTNVKKLSEMMTFYLFMIYFGYRIDLQYLLYLYYVNILYLLFTVCLFCMFAAVSLSLLGLLFGQTQAVSADNICAMVSVVDGDTINVSCGLDAYIVRLIGIDTPEE